MDLYWDWLDSYQTSGSQPNLLNLKPRYIIVKTVFFSPDIFLDITFVNGHWKKGRWLHVVYGLQTEYWSGFGSGSSIMPDPNKKI